MKRSGVYFMKRSENYKIELQDDNGKAWQFINCPTEREAKREIGRLISDTNYTLVLFKRNARTGFMEHVRSYERGDEV